MKIINMKKKIIATGLVLTTLTGCIIYNNHLMSKIDSLTQAIEVQETQAKEAINTLTDTINTLEGESEELTSRIKSLKTDLSKTTKELENTTIKLEETQNTLENTKKALEEANAKIPSALRSSNVKVTAAYEVQATAYTVSIPECGKDDGITASGTKVKEGRTIAVDRKLIPLGTKVYVEFPDCPSRNGFYIAEDVGGAIKGKIIDVYIDSYSEAIQFGRRKATIYVLAN